MKIEHNWSEQGSTKWQPIGPKKKHQHHSVIAKHMNIPCSHSLEQVVLILWCWWRWWLLPVACSSSWFHRRGHHGWRLLPGGQHLHPLVRAGGGNRANGAGGVPVEGTKLATSCCTGAAAAGNSMTVLASRSRDGDRTWWQCHETGRVPAWRYRRRGRGVSGPTGATTCCRVAEQSKTSDEGSKEKEEDAWSCNRIISGVWGVIL